MGNGISVNLTATFADLKDGLDQASQAVGAGAEKMSGHFADLSERVSAHAATLSDHFEGVSDKLDGVNRVTAVAAAGFDAMGMAPAAAAAAQLSGRFEGVSAGLRAVGEGAGTVSQAMSANLSTVNAAAAAQGKLTATANDAAATQGHLAEATDKMGSQFKSLGDRAISAGTSISTDFIQRVTDKSLDRASDSVVDFGASFVHLGENVAEGAAAAAGGMYVLRRAVAATVSALAPLAPEAAVLVGLGFAIYEVGSLALSAASAIADWASRVTAAGDVAVLFSEQGSAAAAAQRALTLEFGAAAESFAELPQIAADYGVSLDEAGAAMRRMVDVLDPANDKTAQARDVLKAYGVTSTDAAEALDQFSQMLMRVQDGSAKTHDVLAVLGKDGRQWMQGIADGAGEMSHAFNEADRINAAAAANIEASKQRMASAPHISWLGQMSDWMDGVASRFDILTTRSEDFKAEQRYALSEIETAWKEYQADVLSLTDTWTRVKGGFLDYVAVVLQSAPDLKEALGLGGRSLVIPDAPQDTRPAPPPKPVAESDAGGHKDTSGKALSSYQEELQRKLLLKENWLRQDNQLEVGFWQEKIAAEQSEGLAENSNMMALLQDRLHQAERTQAQYQRSQGEASARAAEQASEQERAAQMRGLEMSSNAAAKGSLDRIQAIGAEVAYAFNAWGGMSAQYKSAMDRLLAADREYETQHREIAKLRIDADAQIARIGQQIETDRLNAEVAAGNITTLQKIDGLRTLTAAAQAEDRARLDAEIASLEKGTKAWEQATQQRRVLTAQQAQDTERLAGQQADAQRQAAVKTSQAWETALDPAKRAMDGMVQGIFQGTQTMGQLVQRSAANMAISYAQSIAEMTMKFVAFRLVQAMGWDQMALGMKTQIQSSSMAWMLGEQAKTGATVTGNAARTTADAAGDSTFLGRIGLKLASWLGLETGKTAATVTGNAARTTADAAGDSTFLGRVGLQLASWLGLETGKTAETTVGAGTRTTALGSEALAAIAAAKAIALATIPASAAEAGAAAFASICAIPIIGPVLAPEAAMAAYAGAMAFLPMASAAGGWDRVPYDGALAQLHQDEMVLPAYLANPLRDAVANMPSYGVPAGFAASAFPQMPAMSSAAPEAQRMRGGDTHNHYNNISAIDAKGVERFCKQHSAILAAAVTGAARNFSAGSSRK